MPHAAAPTPLPRTRYPRAAGLLALAMCLLASCRAPSPAPHTMTGQVTAETVRAAVRAAVGYEPMRGHRNGIEVVEADSAGRDTVIYRFGPAGELIRLQGGGASGDLGFDGGFAWQVTGRSQGVADPLSQRNREKLLTPLWVRGGWWLDERAPFEFAVVDSLSDASRVALSLRAPGGVVGSTIFVDRTTSLPSELVVEYERGPNRIVFGDWRSVLGFRFPFRVTATYAGSTSTRRVVTVRPVAEPVRTAFAVPPLPDDTTFDGAQPAALQVARAAPYADGTPGHVFVRPRVDGRDVGWWNFDSGAEGMTIDAALADSLGLPVVGRTAVIGADGRRREATIRRAHGFTLGRLTYRDPLLLAEDLSATTALPGTKRGGVVGYPAFRRSVVQFAAGGDSVALYDPATYSLPARGRWAALSFIDLTPAACAALEGGRRGLFQLDTGAGGTVSFYASYLARENLLAGRDTQTVTSAGTGGTFRTTTGHVAWFELAGHRWERPLVEFRTGGFSREGGAGVVGREFLRAFTIVFDYPHRRLALLPADGSTVSEDAVRSLERCGWPDARQPDR
jgi:aspartyl protease